MVLPAGREIKAAKVKVGEVRKLAKAIRVVLVPVRADRIKLLTVRVRKRAVLLTPIPVAADPFGHKKAFPKLS